MSSKPFLLLLLLIAIHGSPSSSQAMNNGSGFASFTGSYSDRGMDLDGDGGPDHLNVDVGINVFHPGEYSITGYLCDRDDNELAWSADHRNLTAGNHIMQLVFDLIAAGKEDYIGPYRLGNLSLTWGSASMGLIPCDWREDAYETASYNFSPSTSLNQSDRILSGSGEGQMLLTLSIHTAVPVVSGRYMYDILGLNMPPISTPYDVIPLDSKKFQHGGYSYGMDGLYIPGKPNNYTIIARGVKNLNLGLMKLQGDLQRTWISSQFQADQSGLARAETDLISPRGSYHVKIFGDAMENASQVDLTMTVVKKIIVDGPFRLAVNTTGFPEGDYSIRAQAINGSFCFDELQFEAE